MPRRLGCCSSHESLCVLVGSYQKHSHEQPSGAQQSIQKSLPREQGSGVALGVQGLWKRVCSGNSVTRELRLNVKTHMKWTKQVLYSKVPPQTRFSGQSYAQPTWCGGRSYRCSRPAGGTPALQAHKRARAAVPAWSTAWPGDLPVRPSVGVSLTDNFQH